VAALVVQEDVVGALEGRSEGARWGKDRGEYPVPHGLVREEGIGEYEPWGVGMGDDRDGVEVVVWVQCDLVLVDGC
jgi:hypothetical protein